MADGASPARRASPLRIRWPRLRLWAIALFGIGLAPIVAAPFYGFHDWSAFWTAGNLVGTPDIVSTEAMLAWQRERGLGLAIFPYPPPAALLLWPFARLPLDWSFWVHAGLMLAAAVAAGVLGSRVYGLRRDVAVLAALGWAPVTAAVTIGQNTPFALLLAMVALSAAVAGRRMLPGAAAGALLYKPTFGLPVAGLFVLRRRWAAVATVILGVGAWYVLGIPASGGLVTWPREWLGVVGGYFAEDAAINADKAVSLPGLLSRVGVPDLWAVLAGGLLVLAALPRLVRAPLPEAGAGALLVGVAASPHAWGYDAVLLLPIVWWALAGGLAEPWRTRLVVAAYVLVPFWLVSVQTVVSAVAVVVLGAYVVWLGGFWRGAGARSVPAAGGQERGVAAADAAPVPSDEGHEGSRPRAASQ